MRCSQAGLHVYDSICEPEKLVEANELVEAQSEREYFSQLGNNNNNPGTVITCWNIQQVMT